MSIRSISIVAVRVLGLVVIVMGVRLTTQTFSAGADLRSLVAAGGLTGIALIVLGVGFWLAAEGVADGIVRGAEPQEDEEAAGEGGTPTGVGPVDLQAVATAILGLWVITEGIVHAGSALSGWLLSLQEAPGPFGVSAGQDAFFRSHAVSSTIQAVVFVALGLTLVWAAYGLSDAIQGMWARRGRRVRAHQLELLDEIGDLRTHWTVGDEGHGYEVAALTFYDEELRPRVRMGAFGPGQPAVAVYDEDGNRTWTAP